MTDKWQAGKTYVPGSLVVPSTAQQQANTQPQNPGFETGDLTGWSTSDPARWAVLSGGAYNGTYYAQTSGSGLTSLSNDERVPVKPGQQATVSAMGSITNHGTDDAGFQVVLNWYDSGGAELPEYVPGNLVSGKGGYWTASSASGRAPTGAATFGISLSVSNGTHGSTVAWDQASFALAIQSIPQGLVYKATQAAPGKSGSAEPAWPGTTGVPVTDNEVTWEGVIATRLVWKAVPLLKSGATEPTWPEATGATVHDGTIDWVASTAQITDANCPQSKVVAIMASKVFAADGDIVRFSATVNPLDWTTSQDAGYLPTGLQQANANDAAVLAPYRSNLTVFNASSFQNWQVDPDPAAMAILDQMEGIGSNWQQAAQPVGNDLYYLSQLGVRSVSIAAGTDNLAAGDVGMPIDELVRAAVKLDSTILGPRAAYYPSAGQYWLAVAPTGTDPVVFVHTLNGGKGKWSRYLFPFSVDAFSQLGNDLYIRHGDEVSVVDESVATDDKDGASIDFAGTVWWPWLDNGAPAQTKMLESVEYVGTGQAPSISIGYDQRDPNAFTMPYLIDADTLPGDPIPIPVAAPTMSVKLQFAGGAAWSVQQVSLNLLPMPGQP